MKKCKCCGRLLGDFELTCSSCGAGRNYDPDEPNTGRDVGIALLLIFVGVLLAVANSIGGS